VWHRDFHDAQIVGCPDASVVGQTRSARWPTRAACTRSTRSSISWWRTGAKLRWRTTIANHRPHEVDRMVPTPARWSASPTRARTSATWPSTASRCACCGFVVERGPPVMPLERAVWRLTGELGDWLGVDAGHLRVGDRADLVVIDPTGLDARLDAYHEAPMEGLSGLVRMVNRSDAAAEWVLIRGRVASRRGVIEPSLGHAPGFGQFLPGRTARPESIASTSSAPALAPSTEAA
jgi:N-acyl-D-aspartate/D-glutamate deacylase